MAAALSPLLSIRSDPAGAAQPHGHRPSPPSVPPPPHSAVATALVARRAPKLPWYRTERGRRWAVASCLLGLYFVTPFVTVGGRPLLGFDRTTLRLYVGGVGLWMDDLFLVLLAVLLGVALILLFTVWLGRVWCGWACPQTVILDLRDQLRALLRVRSRNGQAVRLAKRSTAELLFLLFNVAGAATLVAYVIPPGEIVARIRDNTLPFWAWATWGVTFTLLYGELLGLGRRFCTRVCPYAKLQGVLFDRATLVVEYDRTRMADCIDCKRCVKVCPTEIDIRDGLQVECIACGECIDACDAIMAKVGREPRLIQFHFGSTSAEPARVVRPAVVVLAVACVALTIGLVHAAVGRAPVEVSVLRDRFHLFHVAQDGRLMNSYTLVAENRTGAPVALTGWVEGIDGLELVLPHNPVSVAPGAVYRTRFVLVLVAGHRLAPGNHPVTVRLMTAESEPIRVAAATAFTVPEATERKPPRARGKTE